MGKYTRLNILCLYVCELCPVPFQYSINRYTNSIPQSLVVRPFWLTVWITAPACDWQACTVVSSPSSVLKCKKQKKLNLHVFLSFVSFFHTFKLKQRPYKMNISDQVLSQLMAADHLHCCIWCLCFRDYSSGIVLKEYVWVCALVCYCFRVPLKMTSSLASLHLF